MNFVEKKHGQLGVCISTSSEIKECYYQLGKYCKNTVSTEERVKNILLLQQLLEIRDYWNELDEYKWKQNINNWCIRLFYNKIETILLHNETYIFSFKTEERAIEFAKIFEKELLQVLSI